MFTLGDFQATSPQAASDVFVMPNQYSLQTQNDMLTMPYASMACQAPYQQDGLWMEAAYTAIPEQALAAPQEQSNCFPQRPPGVFAQQADQDNGQGTVVVDGQAYTTMYVPVYVSPSEKVDASPDWAMQPKGRQGKSSQPKKMVGAVLPEEIWESKRALQERIKEQCQAPPAEQVKRGLSGSTCSTWEGVSEAGDNSDSLEDGCKAGSENAEEVAVAGSRLADSTFTDRVETALLDLESNDSKKQQLVLQWVVQEFWPLAFDKRGCRVVQKAMDVGSPAYQLQLLGNLPGYVYDALQSAHANYVLQKFIEVVRPERIQFIVNELAENVVYVARHRFGCRIVQRLLEHCTPSQMASLIEKILVDAPALCRHQYGNFVLQHILQYGSLSQRHIIAEGILPDIMRLSKHRLASHIVSCALVNCAREDIQRLVDEVFQDATKLYQLSRREYGSFVVREVNRAAKMLKGEGERKDVEVMDMA